LAKPGLDGHSNGIEQIALAARDVGFEVIYQGIRLSVDDIVNTAIDEDVHLMGLSILSGAHVALVHEIMSRLAASAKQNLPVVVGGIIPESDRHILLTLGVEKVYTPKNYQLNVMLSDMIQLLNRGVI
jgi:(2R)-ethylmalonyl-CoA mutase